MPPTNQTTSEVPNEIKPAHRGFEGFAAREALRREVYSLVTDAAISGELVADRPGLNAVLETVLKLDWSLGLYLAGKLLDPSERIELLRRPLVAAFQPGPLVDLCLSPKNFEDVSRRVFLHSLEITREMSDWIGKNFISTLDLNLAQEDRPRDPDDPAQSHSQYRYVGDSTNGLPPPSISKPAAQIIAEIERRHLGIYNKPFVYSRPLVKGDTDIWSDVYKFINQTAEAVQAPQQLLSAVVVDEVYRELKRDYSSGTSKPRVRRQPYACLRPQPPV